MAYTPGATPVQVLYIGRVEPNHEKLWDQLQREGIAIAFARTQTQGLHMAKELQPQLIVVNTANSAFSGERLCRALGRRLPGAQRLLITEHGAGLNVPCELRLVRPFTGRKLRESVLRLLEIASPTILKAGPLELDLVTRIVSGPKGRVRLTPKESLLLSLLMQHPNQVVSRKELMERVWETTYMKDTRTIDVHMRWLREKIEPDPARPQFLQTRRGVGYVLVIAELEVPADEETPEAD
jgi:DNA-binding response OmpR family regulator